MKLDRAGRSKGAKDAAPMSALAQRVAMKTLLTAMIDKAPEKTKPQRSISKPKAQPKDAKKAGGKDTKKSNLKSISKSAPKALRKRDAKAASKEDQKAKKVDKVAPKRQDSKVGGKASVSKAVTKGDSNKIS